MSGRGIAPPGSCLCSCVANQLCLCLAYLSGFRVRSLPSRRCHGGYALWFSYVHGKSVVTGIVGVFLFITSTVFCNTYIFFLNISFVSGSRSDHVPSIRCQSGPVEFGYDRVPVSDGSGAFHGPDATSPENVLRTQP